MIDFHSHILPNIDDGSTSIGETINLIEEAKKVGFTGIISTSHYIQGYYEFDCNERRQLLDIIQNKMQAKDSLNLELYLGSEIYFSSEIIDLIKDKKASTINNTRYILFELPMNTKPLFVKELVYDIIQNGYKPIIAHPERYSYVQEQINYVQELADLGTLFQANYGSIIGMYGNDAKKTLKKLLKENLINFLGSDVHRAGQIYPKIPKILKKLNKIVSSEQLEKLTTLNAQQVLNDEDIEQKRTLMSFALVIMF